MIADPPIFAKEVYAERGQQIYNDRVKQAAEQEHEGEFAAIDIVSGEYEFNANDYMATENLLIRYPHAQIWLARVGYPAAYRIGSVRKSLV